jgi:hypothetical protein
MNQEKKPNDFDWGISRYRRALYGSNFIWFRYADFVMSWIWVIAFGGIVAVFCAPVGSILIVIGTAGLYIFGIEESPSQPHQLQVYSETIFYSETREVVVKCSQGAVGLRHSISQISRRELS